MSLKVVILNDYGSITGGSTAVAFASAIGLAGRGLPVTLLTAVAPVSENMRNIPGLKMIGLGQQEIGADPHRFRAFARGIYNGAGVAALRKLLADFDSRETIVHVHTWTKALSCFPIHAAIQLGFKVVLTMHDFFITCPTGGFFVHGKNELCERTPLSMDCISCHCDRRSYAQKLFRVARTAIQNRILHVPEGLSHLIGVSQMSVDVMRQSLPANVPVTIVRNPIDCRDLGPVDVEANESFLFIGRFSEEKGVLLFAEAAGRLGIPAVFIGDGEARAVAERLCPMGTFTGWLPPAEVAQWLRRARALVFPPLWYETLGLVVVEAASHGVPAIIADRCAATDYIRDGESGLWFEHGSADGLCQQLAAIQKPGAAGPLGRNAYDWYWANPWNTEKHVDHLLDLYEGVLRSSPKRHET